MGTAASVALGRTLTIQPKKPVVAINKLERIIAVISTISNNFAFFELKIDRRYIIREIAIKMKR